MNSLLAGPLGLWLDSIDCGRSVLLAGKPNGGDRRTTTMQETYHVRLSKDYLVFSAAHFITFAGNICERLHGHNYGVEIEVEGPLDENSYVIDFIALRDAAKHVVDRLDHHVLLPTEHDQIHVAPDQDQNEVTATFESRRWVFPHEDCVLLPVPNTTAELLAKFIGLELVQLLKLGSDIPCTRFRVGVDENRGQWGIWTKSDF